VAYSWVGEQELVVSDEELALAFKYYRGGYLFIYKKEKKKEKKKTEI
jgi:hypothetical protein